MNQRLLFIDFLKGIGIILVVWGHLYNPVPKYIYTFHMPLFFIISGYLFNVYTIEKLKTKTLYMVKVLLVYYFLSYLTFLLVNYLRGTYFQYNSIFQLFNGSEIYRYNVPLWFLLCLIETVIIYYFINRFCQKYRATIIVTCLSVLGFFLGKMEINIPYHLDSSLTVLVFFHLGYLANKNDFVSKIQNLSKTRSIFLIITAITVYLCLTIPNTPIIYIRTNEYTTNIFSFIVISISACLALFIISVKVKKIQPVNYLGQHSLIIFSCHSIMIGFLGVLPLNTYITNPTILGIVHLLAILILSVILIQLFNLKYFKVLKPYFGMQ